MIANDDNSDVQDDKPPVARTAVTLQRMKLEKLMKNPVRYNDHYIMSLFAFFYFSFLIISFCKDKPVVIPDRQKDKKLLLYLIL